MTADPEATGFDRWIDREEPQALRRGAWILLAIASAVAAGVILHLNHESTFFFDEVIWFSDLAARSGVDSILYPHNGHLIGTTRLVYLGTESAFGTHYVIMRILGVASVIATSWLFFALAKRRVGSILALIPAILLLFYGSAWQHVVSPIGFTVLLSISFGLAAMLSLDREDRRGDALACAFACAACFTYSVGVMFTVGIAILVLLRRDRLRRAWIFLVPLLLYATWWLWATQFDQDREEASHLSKIASFFADSAANIAGALSGANGLFDSRPNVAGWVVAGLLVVALCLRISRRSVPPLVWAGLAILAAFWLAAGLAGYTPLSRDSQATAVRYVYPASIAVLLVAVGAAAGKRPRPAAIGVVLAIGAFSLAMNVKLLRNGSEIVNGFGRVQRVNLAMLELANGAVPGAASGQPQTVRPELADHIGFLEAVGPDRDSYLRAAARFGSPAYTLDEIRERGEQLGPYADSALIQAYAPSLARSGAPPARHECAHGDLVELPKGGAYLRLDRGEPGEVDLSRFGEPPGYPAEGEVIANAWSRLEIPADDATDPWKATAPTGELEVCPLGS